MKKTQINILVYLISLLPLAPLMAQSEVNNEVSVVGQMFQAFGAGDMEALQKTLSPNTVWNYNGSEFIPYAGTYNGKAEVVGFIGKIMTHVDVLDFQVKQMISEGNTVVVLGSEKQQLKKNGQILEQDWVQIYTVENGLITKMEEFANTAYAEKLFKI